MHASLIVVLTRGGSTARLVAKYRPVVPVLTVAVPVLTTGKWGEGGSIMSAGAMFGESLSDDLLPLAFFPDPLPPYPPLQIA